MLTIPPLPPREQTCCFTGHRDMTYTEMQEVLPLLTRWIEELIRSGITTFIVGGARGFDTLVAIQLINLRRHLYPLLKLVLARPCPDQTARWPATERSLHETVRREADLDILLSDHYYNGCMHRRNAFMVEHSSYLLAYVTRNSGGSYHTLTLAKKQGLKIRNLSEYPPLYPSTEQLSMLEEIRTDAGT